jgi:hypothetical protein
MTGTEPVRTADHADTRAVQALVGPSIAGAIAASATLSETRARAAVAARRYGVPPTMVRAVARRRAAGDWRGACAAADVDLCLNPDSVRRRHGAEIADQLLAVLGDLAPDLLRWHLPRRGHGVGDLLAGSLVPLAELTSDNGGLTLAAATPQFALDAGQRIVLVLLGGTEDAATRTVLEAVHGKQAERHSLLRHPMFWGASAAPELAGLCDATPAEHEITRLQDSGAFAEAWHAAGIELHSPGTTSRTRWLAALPVRLPGLAGRIGEALPGVDEAVLRSGVGAVVLSGLGSAAAVARAVSGREALGLPVVPNAVWSRVLDADLLRFGYLGEHELHPLVASALLGGPPAATFEPDEWLYREVPFIVGPCLGDDGPALWIQCGSTRHRVAYHDDAWRILDHSAHQGRESLLVRLGGPSNPCQQASDYLSSGRHVIELAESLLNHGRVADVGRLLSDHAGAGAVLRKIDLPGGGTVGAVLAALRGNRLQHRMVLAGGTHGPDAAIHRLPFPPKEERRRARKGVPARTHR